MRIVAAVLLGLLTASVSLAGDRCFCSPYTYVAPYQQPFYYSTPYNYDVDVQKVDVINRQVSISPLKAPQKDLPTEQALAKQWQDVTSAIPISPRKDYLRKFQFTKNWPTVAPAKTVQKQQQKVEFQTTTQVLYGAVRQNIVIQGGTVSLDVPPALLAPLISPPPQADPPQTK
jgi:hypothetical protein